MIQRAIRIYKPTELSVIVSRTEIVEIEVGIEVVAPVSERIVFRFRQRAAVVVRSSEITPGVIGIGNKLRGLP